MNPAPTSPYAMTREDPDNCEYEALYLHEQ